MNENDRCTAVVTEEWSARRTAAPKTSCLVSKRFSRLPGAQVCHTNTFVAFTVHRLACIPNNPTRGSSSANHGPDVLVKHTIGSVTNSVARHTPLVRYSRSYTSVLSDQFCARFDVISLSLTQV